MKERGLTIIGASGAGMSAIAEIREAFPDQTIVVIEGAPFPKSEPYLIKAQPMFAYETMVEHTSKNYIDGTRSQKNNYKKRRKK